MIKAGAEAPTSVSQRQSYPGLAAFPCQVCWLLLSFLLLDQSMKVAVRTQEMLQLSAEYKQILVREKNDPTTSVLSDLHGVRPNAEGRGITILKTCKHIYLVVPQRVF